MLDVFIAYGPLGIPGKKNKTKQADGPQAERETIRKKGRKEKGQTDSMQLERKKQTNKRKQKETKKEIGQP